jgi:hypothetical protein
MSRRRASATAGLLAALVIVVIIIIAAGSSGGDESGGGGLPLDHSLQHIRTRNLQLQAMIAALTERQTLRIRGYGPRRPSPSPGKTSKAVPKTEPRPAPVETSAAESECDPNYEGACLDPNASDYDCAGGSGDGPTIRAKSGSSGSTGSDSTQTGTASDARRNEDERFRRRPGRRAAGPAPAVIAALALGAQ